MLSKYLKVGTVAISCAALGAGASAIASAGAATGTSSPTTGAQHKAALAPRRLLARTVHGDFVLATKSGFVTVTLDRGVVQSVNGQQLTISEGTKKATYKTIKLTIPANARVRDNGTKATLADVKSGQRVIVLQGPKHTLVIARNPRTA